MRATFVALLLAVAAALALEAVSMPVLVLVVAAFAVAAPFSRIARVLLVAAVFAVATLAALAVWRSPWLLAAFAAALGARPLLEVVKLARMSPATRRNYPAAIWAGLRWRWLARNLALAPADRRTRHRARAEWAPTWGVASRALTWTRGPEGASERVVGRMHYPPARFRPDDFGIVAEVRSVPGTGREQLEAAAPHLANAWACHRVQVSQPAPGRLLVRGLRTDPLTLPLPAAAAENSAALSFGQQVSGDQVRKIPRRDPLGAVLGIGDRLSGVRTWRPDNLRSPKINSRPSAVTSPSCLWLGRDEFGVDRFAELPRLGGIVIGGLTGSGKSSLINGWLMQLAPSPAVQFCVVDGKGASDLTDWQPRSWLFCGDELPAAAANLEDVHAEMRRRFATGCRNMWNTTGPTEETPLIIVIVDEAHGFLDEASVKGDKQAEAHVRTCRAMLGQLIRKGRAALVCSVLLSQKVTADSVPTQLRDNAGLGICFATRTTEAAIAALGEDIRSFPSYSPVTLQAPEYVGAATVSLRTGLDPYTRVRTPTVDPAEVLRVATSTAHLRRVPGAVAESSAPASAEANLPVSL